MFLESNMDLTDPRDNKNFFLEETTTRKILTPLARGIFLLMARITVTGVEYLPKSGAVILAANHLTNFDVFPMQFVLPRLIFFMGKAELFDNPLLDPFLRRLGGFPVQRGKRDQWALRHAASVLKNRQVLGIFPEGKRSKGQGLRTAKSGAARLALDAKCPVVPMAVDGTERLFKRFPARTQIKLSLGEPIWPEDHESPLALTDRIMFSIADLLPAPLRGVYAQKAKGFG